MLLCGLALIAIYVFLQNPFLTNHVQPPASLMLGTPTNIYLQSGGSSSKALMFYGSVVQGGKIQQSVNVVMGAASDTAMVRAKVFMFADDGEVVPVEVVCDGDWQQKLDGYYYCNRALSQNLVQNFARWITVPPAGVGLGSSSLYTIVFAFEALPDWCDYNAIWGVV